MQRLDKKQVAHAFSRAALTYDKAAIIQQKVLNEHLERLQISKLAPQRILDLGSGTGSGATGLARLYSKSRITAVDMAQGMLLENKRRLPRFRNHIDLVCGDMENLPLAAQSYQLVFSNLALQWTNDIQQVLKEIRRVMEVGGLLSFTTVGPDTLKELRTAWSAITENNHTHDFMDMHIIGDALIDTGFAEPVLDVDRYTLTYPNLRMLLKDLKMLGTTNASVQRSRGLLGKKEFMRLKNYYDKQNIEGQLPLTYEIIFGHAWIPANSARKQDGSTVSSFPVSQIKRRR